LLFIFQNSSLALEVDPECLNHFGGSTSDYDCYALLSKAFDIENKNLLKEIQNTIPLKNPNKVLVRKFYATHSELLKYCEIERQVLYGWVEDKTSSLKYQDTAYVGCIFKETTSFNHRLKRIISNYKDLYP
jgi:hypothetical protein